MSTDLAFPDYSYAPPELLVDRYHPSNSAFFAEQKKLRLLISAKCSQMIAWHVQAVKMRLLGRSNIEIAEELGHAPATVSGVISSDKGKELLTLLHHMQQLNEGPSIDHRKRFLWEIAMDARESGEAKDLNISIAAIKEMNRMDGVGNPNTQNNPQVTLVINQSLLPRGALD